MARTPKPIHHAKDYAAAMSRRYPEFRWYVQLQPDAPNKLDRILVACHHPGVTGPFKLPRKGARWS